MSLRSSPGRFRAPAERSRVVNGKSQLFRQLFLIAQRGFATSPFAIYRQGFFQRCKHVGVIDDQAALLAGIDAVGAGDGLHQSVIAHGFVG